MTALLHRVDPFGRTSSRIALRKRGALRVIA